MGPTIIICVFIYLMCFASADKTHSQDLDQVNGELSALQKHVTFFDLNNDGVVYPSETYKGLRSIGCNLPLSAAASAIINAALSSKTLPPGKGPDMSFPVYIENIKKAKHGSDTGSYDTEGSFVPSKFDEIFSKHAHSRPDALTSDELNELLKANRKQLDFKGWFASFLEWRIVYSLAKDADGFLQKERLRGVYDGSLFKQLKDQQS